MDSMFMSKSRPGSKWRLLDAHKREYELEAPMNIGDSQKEHPGNPKSLEKMLFAADMS
jgi:hypothetical protein